MLRCPGQVIVSRRHQVPVRFGLMVQQKRQLKISQALPQRNTNLRHLWKVHSCLTLSPLNLEESPSPHPPSLPSDLAVSHGLPLAPLPRKRSL